MVSIGNMQKRNENIQGDGKEVLLFCDTQSVILVHQCDNRERVGRNEKSNSPCR